MARLHAVPIRSWLARLTALLLIGGTLSCTDALTPPETMDSSPAFGHVENGGFLILCKYGTDAYFTVTWGSAQTNHFIPDGQCDNVHSWATGSTTEVTVTELVDQLPDGFRLDRIEVMDPGGGVQTVTGTNAVTGFFAGYTISYFNVPHDGGGEGCTPGYWKTRPHQDDWPPTGYDQADLYNDVFGVNNLVGSGLTLLDGVALNGNSYNSFVRHSVAALLNAMHPDVSYDLSAAEVIAIVQDAHASGDFGAKVLLQGFNEQGCTIG